MTDKSKFLCYRACRLRHPIERVKNRNVFLLWIRLIWWKIQIAGKAGHHIFTPDIGLDSAIFSVHLNPESKGNIIEAKDQQTGEETPVAFAQREFEIVFPFLFILGKKRRKLFMLLRLAGRATCYTRTHSLVTYLRWGRARACYVSIVMYTYALGAGCINKCKR